MPVRITAKHTTVSDSTKQHIEKVCAKLDQYFANLFCHAGVLMPVEWQTLEHGIYTIVPAP